MNECDIERNFVEHDNGFAMVNIRNIEIRCDFGSSNGGFNQHPRPHLSHSKFPNT